MLSALGPAFAGVQRSLELFQRAAERATDPEGGDLVQGIVETQVAKAELAASVAVIRTADDLQGTLLDLYA